MSVLEALRTRKRILKAELKAAGANCNEIRVPPRFLKGTKQQGTAEEVAAHPFFVLRATWPG